MICQAFCSLTFASLPVSHLGNHAAHQQLDSVPFSQLFLVQRKKGCCPKMSGRRPRILSPSTVLMSRNISDWNPIRILRKSRGGRKIKIDKGYEYRLDPEHKTKPDGFDWKPIPKGWFKYNDYLSGKLSKKFGKYLVAPLDYEYTIYYIVCREEGYSTFNAKQTDKERWRQDHDLQKAQEYLEYISEKKLVNGFRHLMTEAELDIIKEYERDKENEQKSRRISQRDVNLPGRN